LPAEQGGILEEGVEMKNRATNLLLALVLAVGLAACGEESRLLEPENIEDAELTLIVDPDLTEAIVLDAEASINGLVGSVAPSEGTLFAQPNEEAVAQARELLRQARQKFYEARQAWLRGDTPTAAELAQEARELVAEALVLVFGEEAYDHLLQRVEHIITWLEAQVDEEASELLARIRELRDEAVALRDSDLIAATERLILAVQIAHRERVHHRRQQLAWHARLSFFMAGVAVDVAGEYAGVDATEAQLRVLRHAAVLRDMAQDALSIGRFRLALSLAREAVNVSLIVVMLEPTTDADKVQAMIDLSNLAIAAAEEAIATASESPGSLPVHLLELAKQLQAHGIDIADTYPRRAIYILWHASVTAYGVVEIVS
jgi:HEPN domain-containing protein